MSIRSRGWVPVLLSGLLLGAARRESVVAAGPEADSPEALVELVRTRFATGSAEAFDSVYPDPAGRSVVRAAIAAKSVRRGDLAAVVRREAHSAIVLLGGTVESASSEDEANRTRAFSGLYRAADSAGTWRLVAKLPIDDDNLIRAQRLDVDVTPGRGIAVVDRMTLSIGNPAGFVARLNGRARIEQVELDGRPARHLFGGNLLWVAAPRRGSAILVLRYRLDQDPPTPPDSAPPAFGAYHNTHLWHPFFEYTSARDVGRLTVTARISAEYRLTTSLEQTETVTNGRRTVRGASDQPNFLATLIFDREWRPTRRTVQGVRLETFTTAEFRQSPDSLAGMFAAVYPLLRSRFGPLRSGYLGAVEDRSIGRGGFRVRMNDLIVAGEGGGNLATAGPLPSAPFAHEVAHAWTMDATGPAANFLREGWAQYVEALAVERFFGAEEATTLREIARSGYLAGPDGKQSILGDPDNGRLHYTKGLWIFTMLERTLGRAAFDRGIRGFLARFGGPAGYEELARSLSAAAGRPVAPFLVPWLSSRTIPDVSVSIAGSRVTLGQRQAGDRFDLPIDVRLETASGPVVRSVHLTTSGETVVDAGAPVSAVRVDPDHHLLVRRHEGEVARFELVAPGAKTVALLGLSQPPLVAADTAGTWIVEVPLTEGRYFWVWLIDGKAEMPGQTTDTTRYGVRIVRPLRSIDVP